MLTCEIDVEFQHLLTFLLLSLFVDLVPNENPAKVDKPKQQLQRFKNFAKFFFRIFKKKPGQIIF